LRSPQADNNKTTIEPRIKFFMFSLANELAYIAKLLE
jgi:hypothetical protein